ncbi:MAG: type II toxin-antitoxin system Phd/YefM family antitoxin [Lachnospiraceae bacterium]|nr:type II toxin-antitoxin system Phd/YefM family antitoxin [Lachnospiraceae bacterium]
MPKIIPIKELKDTARISELCHVAEEPIYITKNGYGDMVIMSIDLFEKIQAQQNLIYGIDASEKQIREGKTKDAVSALTALRDKYDL